MGRHREDSRSASAGPRRRRWRSMWIVVALVAAGSVAALVAGLPPPPRALSQAAHTCSDQRAITVFAAPEIATVVTDVIRVLAPPAGGGTPESGGACPAPVVTVAGSYETAEQLRKDDSDRPDVWIPDSSIWTEQLAAQGVAVPLGNPSVARSPLVVAVPSNVLASQPRPTSTLNDLLPISAATPGSVRWSLPDPTRAIGTVAAMIELKAAAASRPDGSAVLTTILRSARYDLPHGPATGLLADASAAEVAVPTTEQQVFTFNRAPPAHPMSAVYPGVDALSADYPFVVFAADRGRRARATDLLEAMRSNLGRGLVTAAGFRDRGGVAGPALSAQPGIDPSQPGAGRVPDAPQAAAAIQAFQSIARGSRMLAVIDVSGSMATVVAGTHGATRLDLALQAAINGLALYPDDTVAGLWTFSTQMTPTTDYQPLVPLVLLGRGPDGSSGRERLARALAGVHVVPDGSTGLYDTVLDAVRTVRKGWDPTRVNSVVLVTDGANEDPQGIDLPTLLKSLHDEDEPARPVPVVAIAYGPSGDLAALQAITNATAGQAYLSRDPRTIGNVMLDAIGRRACASGC